MSIVIEEQMLKTNMNYKVKKKIKIKFTHYIGLWINFKRKPGKGMWYKQKELLIKELQSGFKSENKSKVMFCYSNNKQVH